MDYISDVISSKIEVFNNPNAVGFEIYYNKIRVVATLIMKPHKIRAVIPFLVEVAKSSKKSAQCLEKSWMFMSGLNLTLWRRCALPSLLIY